MSKRRPEINIDLHAKQGVALQTIATEVLYGGAAGGGKLLPLETLLPTPHGWIAMGDVRPGSDVFDETGTICRVTHVFDVEETPNLYRLTFDDKTEIDCCENHQWLTYSSGELAALTRYEPEWRVRRRAKRPSRATGKRSQLFTDAISLRNAQRDAGQPLPAGTVRTTSEIAATLRTNSGRLNHAVPVTGCLDLPDAILPIDPYVLGAWLGDGTSVNACITGIDSGVWGEIERRGYSVLHRKKASSHWIQGLMNPLISCGLIGNKHIPSAYLRASRKQRLDLLRGLMDTDGTVARNSGSAEFCNTNERIVDGLLELVNSLGWKATKRQGVAKLYGRSISPKWTVKWMASDYVFTLSRKRDIQQLSSRRTTRFRYITAAQRITSRPGRCISVNSPRRLYLAGRQMVPTHNSFLIRSAAIIWCAMIPGLQVYLFRRLRDDLVKNHIEGPKGFRAMLAPWVLAGFCTMVEDEIRFWNGAKIYLCHCKDEKDRLKYLGAEIHVLLIDELTTFTETIYRFLRGRVRMVGAPVPANLKGHFPRILCGSNPGNVGHHWVKAMFIDGAPPLELRGMNDNEGGMLRQFIPARLDDNPSMSSDDPGYRAKLRGLGNAALVKAMEDGDWNVIAGAYFDCWSTERHVIRPFAIPLHWMRFTSFDWGSAKPFSNGWWAVSDGSILPDGRHYPAGALIRYREWYGAKAPNEGLGLSTAEIAEGIRALEVEKIDYRVADPACWKVDGGPSHAETMVKYGVIMRRADNSRIAGWTQVRDRLIGQDGSPMLYVFETCVDLIRTLPTLQHDANRPEDVDSDGEDHAPDECFVAGTMIQTQYGERPIETIQVGDMVETRLGLRPVTAAFSVGERDVMRVGLSSGRQLVGTANHPVWVGLDGFVPLHTLRYSDMMRPCIIQTSSVASLALFGETLMAIFRRVTTSTTGTTTTQTMHSRIWSALHLSTIGAIILRFFQGMSASVSDVEFALRRSFEAPASVPMPASHHGDDLRVQMMFNEAVQRVVPHSYQIDSRGKLIAPLSVLVRARTRDKQLLLAARTAASPSTRKTSELFGAPTVVGEPTIAGRQKVYNLSVAEAEEYYANGVLVHNCRYACMSRPWTRVPEIVLPIRSAADMTLTEAWRHADPRARAGRGRI